MRALKILVVIMGVILVCGTAALVAAVIARIDRGRPLGAPAPSRVAAIQLELPAGAHIAQTELSADRILVRVVLADGSQELQLFDARSGSHLATIALRTAPSAGATP